MLQVNVIREKRKEIIAGLQKRNLTKADELIDRIISLDQTRRVTQQKYDEALAKANLLSRKIGTLIKANKKEEANQARKTTSEIKKISSKLSDELSATNEELKSILYVIPNVPNKNVPQGEGEKDNVVIHQSDSIPVLQEGAEPHWELIKKYDIIDFEVGSKITGAGFPVYKGKGAKLQRALINFFLDQAVEQGYREVQLPILINKESGYGTGQLPDKEDQMYHIESESFYLLPTAEVPITNIYRNVILSEKELPIKNVGYTPCFRREAGSWGTHVRGLNRLHQFDKVEIVQIRKPEDSYHTLDEMCLYIQRLLDQLELPYRKVLLCGGDLGFNAALTYDMEVYAGAQQRWLEVSSVSNFETFQSNRLKLRLKDKDGDIQLLHTLNGSALALPRIVASILENNQTKKGIAIPKVLVPYTGFDFID